MSTLQKEKEDLLRLSMELARGKAALLIVDEENGFMPTGELPVAHGDEVVPETNRLQREFSWECIVASQDWHPEDHCSFLESGGPFPRHCVRGTHSAELHRDLDLTRVSLIVRKAMKRDKDAFSMFCETGLAAMLKDLGIFIVVVCGLATDYCVKATALDAKIFGFQVVVWLKACRAVDIQPGDGDRAIEEMRNAEIICI